METLLCILFQTALKYSTCQNFSNRVMVEATAVTGFYCMLARQVLLVCAFWARVES
jgi:hypothetical protein